MVSISILILLSLENTLFFILDIPNFPIRRRQDQADEDVGVPRVKTFCSSTPPWARLHSRRLLGWAIPCFHQKQERLFQDIGKSWPPQSLSSIGKDPGTGPT